jgi:hypothetical protein
MAYLSKYNFNDATIGVPFSDTITVILEPCPTDTSPLEVLVSVEMTSVTPSVASGIDPGLCPGYPVGGLTYIPTAVLSTLPTISCIGTFNETLFDEREWEYRDDETGKQVHTPKLELDSTESEGGEIFTISKDSVQPDPYTTGGQFENDFPSTVDTFIRYKPDFRATRALTYTYDVITLCSGVPVTYTFTVTQTLKNNWDLGRDKLGTALTQTRY